jgi:CheY-like chemotaxis protein
MLVTDRRDSQFSNVRGALSGPAEKAVVAARPLILVVEDNARVSAVLQEALALLPCDLATATSLAEAQTIIKSRRPRVIVLDLWLPDASDLQAMHALAPRFSGASVVVVSGRLTTEIVVDVMRLGAVHAFGKPLRIQHFLEVVRQALAAPPAPEADRLRLPARSGVAARWVDLVLRAIDSDGDLKTLQAWAEFAGVSLSGLRSTCYLAHIQPHDARDFMRVLRALVRARRLGWDLDVLLDVGDERTLEPLLERAGLTGGTATATVDEYFDRQQFIPAETEALQLLSGALRKLGYLDP